MAGSSAIHSLGRSGSGVGGDIPPDWVQEHTMIRQALVGEASGASVSASAGARVNGEEGSSGSSSVQQPQEIRNRPALLGGDSAALFDAVLHKKW